MVSGVSAYRSPLVMIFDLEVALWAFLREVVVDELAHERTPRSGRTWAREPRELAADLAEFLSTHERAEVSPQDVAHICGAGAGLPSLLDAPEAALARESHRVLHAHEALLVTYKRLCDSRDGLVLVG